MKQFLKNKKGFTIIEVLIVLAIAGLIMLIVFLAIPTLQRNSRNTQRNNDASLVIAAVNDCINNKNGQTTSCNSADEIDPDFLDSTKLRQLTAVNYAAGFPGNNTSVNFFYNLKCNPAGDGLQVGTTRQFVATFKIEGSGGDVNRCIDG